MNDTPIEDLTISQARSEYGRAKQLITQLEGVLQMANNEPDGAAENRVTSSGLRGYGVGQKCLVRTYASGVHFGTVHEREGQDVVLHNARRIWSWSGAFTLSAIANNGFGSAKLSEVVPQMLVQQCIEIIPCSDSAIAQLEAINAHQP